MSPNATPSSDGQSSSTQPATTPLTQGQSPSQPGTAPDDDHQNHGNTSHHGDGCSTATYHTIQSAVDAVPAGATIVVCAGTYAESVTITKQLTLSGRKGAVIDAAHQPYGIGMTAPYVTVTGMTVENASMDNNAPGDGIITAGFLNGQPAPADHETIRNNVTKNNAGAGIDLLSTSHTVVWGNWSTNNGIGINVANDLGKPSSYNTIIGNVASDNPGGCGIVLADHTGQGIFGTVIIGNYADNNGLGTPSAPDASAGSGILLAAGGAGGAWDNLIALNEASGNGHGGLALHAHAPGLNFSGNVMAFNRVGTNNLRQDTGDPETTGIYLGDASPLTIAVFGNTVHDDHFGIFTAGDVTVLGGDFNRFVNVADAFGSAPSYASAPGGPPGGGPAPTNASAPGAGAPQGAATPQGGATTTAG
ncbi:MAG TPA: NosD domain-containing protein [Acidimicrobiales bacterium]|nr:NosD domain-containing protein [Acidimicrobiales bacterium]